MTNRITEDEWNLIILDYKKGLKPYQLAEKYKRGSSTIIDKLCSLGLHTKRYRFTEEDIEFLRSYYPKGDWDNISKRFPNSSKGTIHSIASKYNIQAEMKRWSSDEIELLRENIGKLSDDELVKLFDGKYTINAIKTKANKKLGYSTSKKWTAQEDEIMRRYYSEMPPKEVLKFLPNRNYNAIIHRAQKLNLQSCVNRPWTEQENEYIKTHWEVEPDYIMGIKLNRTQRCVQYQRNALGLYRRDMNIVTYESLSKYIRGQIWDWKKKSMENCDYKCVFTGSKNFQIHHLYNVNSMINDVFKLNDIKREEDLSDYSKEELENIVNLFISEQDKHPLGVCVSKDIHVLFHSLYGQYNNTPKQWYQFEKDYKNGLYDNYIKEKEAG